MFKFKGREKEYHRSYDSTYYKLNREKIIQRKAEERQARIEWYQTTIRSIKIKCSICPESDWRCLDFHHRNANEKVLEVSQMMAKGFSKEKILTEIAKCDVMCANCHRKIHRN